ncbi:hypothetical protein ABIB57_000484 [Devosia sp. UYZn731]|uniref:hypothetical protein n=1 Tax=Devosia sp. UYZn731 TaxID=3156345 RepID=UPI0033974769
MLVASLGLKARSSDASSQPREQPGDTALLGALSAGGFAISTKDGLESPTWVADKGDCHIEVTTVTPLGWHQSAMADRAGNQNLAYVYAGHVYEHQPVMLTKMDYYWHKLANYFYLAGQPPPVFGVVSSANCTAQSVGTDLIARLLL